MLLHFDDEHDYAQRLAVAAGFAAACIERHRFPDGEVKLRLPARLPARVVLLRSLHQPNEKLVELLLAARAPRDLGARELTLVAPYLAYMRQDMAFAPGEAVSQRIVGGFLGELFDTVITIEPHLHRIAALGEAIPTGRAVALTAAPLLGRWAAERHAQPLPVGPDAESEAWVGNRCVARGGNEAPRSRRVANGSSYGASAVPLAPETIAQSVVAPLKRRRHDRRRGGSPG